MTAYYCYNNTATKKHLQGLVKDNNYIFGWSYYYYISRFEG